MSVSCRGDCEINREGIEFVSRRQVRYKQGMGYCYKCEKGWITKDRICFCCHSKMRYGCRYR